MPKVMHGHEESEMVVLEFVIGACVSVVCYSLCVTSEDKQSRLSSFLPSDPFGMAVSLDGGAWSPQRSCSVVLLVMHVPTLGWSLAFHVCWNPDF